MRIVKIINNWMAICIIYIYIYTHTHTHTNYVQNYIKWLSYEIYTYIHTYIYIYIYIFIVVGVLTMYDAWDIIVEIPSTSNQLKFNTCKAKEPCMMTNPIDQDLAMQSPSST